MIALLRNGGFVTSERTRFYPCLLLAGFAVALAWLAVTARGLNDYAGRPLGSDFSGFYAAGRLLLAGHSPYDQAGLRAMEQSLFGVATPFYSFAYPPVFLLIMEPLARLPYLPALALWQGLSLLLYLAAMLRLRTVWGNDLPGGAPFIAVALAFSAVFVNLIHGQNGFLIAALFALALSWLWEKSALAGICFGLVLFKPQLGLLIPFALAAGRHGRAFAAAAVTVMVLAAITVLSFGWRRWLEFFAAAQFSRAAILDEGAVGYEKMIGIFAALRLWHLPLSLAYAGQIFVSLAVVAAIDFLWRGNADVRRKGAALCLGTLLATPFAFGYDLMLLAPAILLLAALGKQRGLLPYEASLIALVWLMPAAEASLAEIALPLATLGAGAVFVFSLRAALIPDSANSGDTILD